MIPSASRRRARPSIIVTFTPSAAKMQAYSLAMTPEPSTIIVSGMVSMARISSES